MDISCTCRLKINKFLLKIHFFSGYLTNFYGSAVDVLTLSILYILVHEFSTVHSHSEIYTERLLSYAVKFFTIFSHS